jgi:TctA family transporter
MGTIELLLAIIIFTLIGCIAGIITGLIPGIHVNNVAYMILASQAALISFALAVFGWASPTATELVIIVSALVIGNVITHTFLDFIPSVFLGAPEGETALSLLPGHRMMLAGRGYEAIKCSVIGSFGAVVGALILLVPMRLIIGSPVHAYDTLASWMHLLLISISVFLIMTEVPRAKDWLIRPKEYKMEGNVIVSDALPESVAHTGQKVIEFSEIRESSKYDIVMKATVANRLREEESVYLIFEESGNRLTVKVRGQLLVEPEAGDDVIVTGTIQPVFSIQSHVLKRAMAVGVFLLAGLLGVALLTTSGLATHNLFIIKIPAVDQSTVLLFPLFTGLFGLSTLIMSMMDSPMIPEQKVKNVKVKVPLKDQAKSVLSGCAASSASWFPGISAAISTIISVFLHKGSDEGDVENPEKEGETQQFLISVSAVNTSVALFNLMALFVILKSRSGAMKAVEGIMANDLSLWEPLGNVPLALSALLLSALIAAIVSIFLALYFGKLFAKYCSKLNYTRLVKGVIIFLIVMVVLFSGALGLAILAISTCIGMIPPLIGVKRVHLMGCLIVPVILFFL